MPTFFYWELKYFPEECLFHIIDPKFAIWPALSFEDTGKLCIQQREMGLGQFSPELIWSVRTKNFNVYLFILREREHEQRRGQRERGRKRENPKQPPCCQCRAPHRARPHEPRDHDLSRNPVVTSPTQPPRCPSNKIIKEEKMDRGLWIRQL